MMNLYEAAFKTSPAIKMVVSLDDRILAVNDAFRALMERWPEPSGGRNPLMLEDLFHTEDLEVLKRGFRDLGKGYQPLFRGSFRFKRAGKDIFWAELFAVPIRSEGHAVMGIMATALDMVGEECLEWALKHRVSGYSDLFEKEGAAVMVIDEDMTILRVNDLAEKLSGVEKEGMLGRLRFTEWVHPDDLARMVAYHKERRVNQTSVPQHYSCRLRVNDGSYQEHFLSVSLIPSTKRTIAAFSDALPEPLVKSSKTAHDKMFRFMAENSSDQVFIADLSGKITYVSPSVEKVTGYTQEEFKLLSPREYLTPASLERARNKLKEVLEGILDMSQPFLGEYEIIHKDGSVKWVETLGQFIASEYGKPVGFTGASRDITAKKHAEEELKASEAKYRNLTEHLKDVVLVLLPDLTIDYISPVITEMSGYMPGEIIGGGVSPFFVNQEEYQQTLRLFDEILKTKRPVTNLEFLFRAKDREPFYIELTAKPIVKDGRVTMVQCVARDISERKKREERQKKREELLSNENMNLRKSIQLSGRFGNIVGRSKAMMEVYDLLLVSAPTDLNTIIYGESGTGKELVARAIHDLSGRDKTKFVPVNCGAIPEAIIESEFFGYKKGAFTGADQDREGFLDRADGGTLFLDEIGEIGLNMQVKLLRAIEGGGYSPVGSSRVKHSDFRVVAATNKDLSELVKTDKMRPDFFYRLNIIRIDLPPLRKRKEDIPLLVSHFLRRSKHNKDVIRLPREVMATLMQHDWSGNVRELQNVVNQYIALKRIDFTLVGKNAAAFTEPEAPVSASAYSSGQTLASLVQDYEKRIIGQQLEECAWNKSRVAKRLHIDRKTLSVKIEKYNLDPKIGE